MVIGYTANLLWSYHQCLGGEISIAESEQSHEDYGPDVIVKHNG